MYTKRISTIKDFKEILNQHELQQLQIANFFELAL